MAFFPPKLQVIGTGIVEENALSSRVAHECLKQDLGGDRKFPKKKFILEEVGINQVR